MKTFPVEISFENFHYSLENDYVSIRSLSTNHTIYIRKVRLLNDKTHSQEVLHMLNDSVDRKPVSFCTRLTYDEMSELLELSKL